MVRDSYEGIRTCDLLVSILIQGYKKGSRLRHLEYPGQIIALLLVAQLLALVGQLSRSGMILVVSQVGLL